MPACFYLDFNHGGDSDSKDSDRLFEQRQEAW